MATLTDALPGFPYPLGASPHRDGANFALFAEHATGVELVLLDNGGGEISRHRLVEVEDHTFHGYVPGAVAGQRYGYRVSGVYNPVAGMRYNPHKLLLDPYARAIAGDVSWREGRVLGYDRDDATLSSSDSASAMPHSVVVDGSFDWGDDCRPDTEWSDTVIYECHVRGLTQCHPEVPEQLRGTYAGLAHPAVIEHLTTLGVTAVELMPVHHFVDTSRLIDLDLTNYWGYDSIGYFAPSARYSASGDVGGQVTEFQQMVKALHAASLEVILDVVYNHTGEGDERGPTLSFRGIDNPAYYRLDPASPRRYVDVTGCGNTLNVSHPQALQLIMDSLRYWVTEMRVDGFRFDLASALARQFHDVDRLSAFFDIVHQDPVLSHVKLIAEPWDIGEGGYQVGNFPVRWAEWNGKYRDTVRDFWRGQPVGVADLAYRLTGSSDLYQADGRSPSASINFVTCHDGFTLRDLVSYEHKHNLANGESNRDGNDDNRSWNCGAEGDSDDPAILALRARQQRNLLATMLVAQGCPMLLSGDEMSRTQHGNNNAYCQDNETSWIAWTSRDSALLDFTRRLIQLRRSQPVLRRRHFFQGSIGPGQRRKDIVWLAPSGEEMDNGAWWDPQRCSLGMVLNGDAIPERGEDGTRISGDTLLVLLHAAANPITWTLPASLGARFDVLLDTATPDEPAETRRVEAGSSLIMAERSLLVVRVRAADSAP